MLFHWERFPAILFANLSFLFEVGMLYLRLHYDSLIPDCLIVWILNGLLQIRKLTSGFTPFCVYMTKNVSKSRYVNIVELSWAADDFDFK